jgi:antitoxin (DNA-binding transcriptional repressor) of toxin-antitoxin stability system
MFQLMIKLNIHEVKTHLSRSLSKLHIRETILLSKRNQTIAKIRPLPSRRTKNALPGLPRRKSPYPKITVPMEFFDPLPQELAQAFYSEAAKPSNMS